MKRHIGPILGNTRHGAPAQATLDTLGVSRVAGFRPTASHGSAVIDRRFAVVLAQHLRAGTRSRRLVAMQDVGIEVDADGPRDRASDRVDDHRREHVIIIDGRQHTRQRTFEIELTNKPIRKHDREEHDPPDVQRRSRVRHPSSSGYWSGSMLDSAAGS